MKLLLICFGISASWLSSQTAADNARYLLQGNIVVAEQDVDRQLENCFGKVKSCLGLYRKIRDRLDLAIRQARIDRILEIFKEKMIMLCTPSESQASLKFLKKYMQASLLVTKVQQSFTKSEKLQLNAWEELNDTDAETKFYLQKFKQLPDSEYKLLKSAFTDLTNKFVRSAISKPIAEFLVTLTPAEILTLKNYGKAGETSHIRTAIDRKLISNETTAGNRQEILDFNEQLFSLDEY